MSESFSSPFARYLADMCRAGHSASPSQHVELGGFCVQPADLMHLRAFGPALKAKTAGITDSHVLRRRLGMLIQYLEETPTGTPTDAQREIAFALGYFLKGADLIPDHVPGIGLLDDAILVEAAFRRNELELRTHWATRRREWPAAV